MSSSSSHQQQALVEYHIDEKNRALNELIQLQSALIHGATPEFMDTLSKKLLVRDSDFPPRMLMTLFPQQQELASFGHGGGVDGDFRLAGADNTIPPGPLWSVSDHPSTMVGREEKIIMDRIREIEEEKARREKIRLLALQLKEEENVKSVMTSGELVVRTNVQTDVLEDELMRAALSMKNKTQKKELVPDREAKKKLHDLTRYLDFSTNRLIMTAWGVIDHLFMNAKESKVTTKINKQGGEYEARYPALRLSELAQILCSDEVKVSGTELTPLFMCLGASEAEANVAIRIAAVKSALGPDNGENLKHEYGLKAELESCLSGIDDLLISIDELKWVVFPKHDDKEGSKELLACTADGDKLLARWLQDTEQAQLVRSKLDEQRQFSLGMFMVAWRDVQLPKAPFDGRKQAVLKSVIEYCEGVTATNNQKRDVDVSAGLIKRLGVESFPEFIHMRLLFLIQVAEAEEARGHLEAKVKQAELFKMTIKQVKGDLDDLVFAGDELSLAESSVMSVQSLSVQNDGEDHQSAVDPPAVSQPLLLVDESASKGHTKAPGKSEVLPKKKRRGVPKFSRLDSSMMPLEPLDKNFRIRLRGSAPRGLTVISLLKGTAALGRGFDGHAYKDVVTYLQQYASIRIQAAVRGFRWRWRFKAARQRWLDKEAVILDRYFRVWCHVSRHDLDNRKHLWRKMKAWQFYTKRVNRLRYIFQVCHWPFFVWRRWACGRAVAKEKAKFLVTRVMPTLLEMTVFRAWKKFAMKGALILRIEASHLKKKVTSKLSDAFTWIHTWARKRRFIRRHWISRGVHLMRKIRYDRQNAPFQAWRMHVFYKKHVKQRLMASFNIFRQKFAPHVVPISPETLPRRRERFARILAEQLNENSEAGGYGLKGGSSLLSSRESKSKEEDTRKIDPHALSANNLKALLEDPTSVMSSVTESQIIADSSLSAVLTDEPSKLTMISDESVEGGEVGSRGGSPPIGSQRVHSATPPSSEGGSAGGTSRRPSVSKGSGGVSLASTRSSFATNRQVGRKTKLAAAAAKAALRTRPKFDWKKKRQLSGHQMDSDEELDEPLSAKVSRCYETTLGMEPMPDPSELAFLRRSDDYTVKKIRSMLPKWRKWELYAQIEYLGRFMRWAHRAFHHLRHHARFQKAGRNAKRKYWRKQELRVINRWVNWMAAKDAAVLEASRGTGSGAYTQAEILAHLVRRARRFRMTRRNQKYVEMRAKRAALGTEEDEMTAAMRNKRVARFPRKGSLLVPGEDDTGSVGSMGSGPSIADSLYRQEGPADGSGEKSHEDSFRKSVKLPGDDETLPRWDEEDRDAAEELAIRMANLSHRMKTEAFKKSSMSDQQNKNNTGGKERIDEMMAQVMKFENAITGAAIAQQEFYAIDFKRHAADLLVDALVRVYDESQMQYIRGEARKYFRTLRMAMMMKRTKAMCNRKKMVNWVRICRRLAALDDHAHVYRSKRLMWVLFNRWLKFVEKEALDCSPNLVVEVIQRNEKYQRLTLYLEDMDFKKVVYTTNPRIAAAMRTSEALFLRWVMFAQEEKLYRMMTKCNMKLYRLRVLQRCFLAIKTSLPAKEIYQLANNHVREFFPIVRLTCDLEQIAKRFVAVTKRSVLHSIQKYNRKFIGLVRKHARQETNYKNFKVNFKVQLAKRLTVEQRILSESFDFRGTQDFVDVAAPHESKKAQYLPAIMQRVDGKTISDPLPADVIDDDVDDESVSGPISFGPTVKAKRVPGGFKLHKIRLNFLDQIGLVGWQFMWAGDGAEHIESPKRGQWVGAALLTKEITVDKDDFVTGIEYMYEGRGIVSMRFKMHFAGLSPWMGVKTSLATLTSYLDVDMAPPQDFEKYITVLPEEKRRPSCLRSFVIGFSAVWTGSRLSAINLVVRKIKDQNIFSYFWVQNALDAEAKAISDAKVQLFEESIRKRTDRDRFPTIGQSSLRVGFTGNLPSDGDSDDQRESRAATPGSSEGMARRLAEQRKKEKEKKRQEDEGFALMTKRKQESEIKKVELTPSDQEFFDLMRMRSTEVTAAEERVLAFSHRLWKDEKIARNTLLKKLVSLPLIRGLSKWLFDVLSKHLIAFKTADLRGSEMLEDARKLRSHAASFARKKKVLVEMIYRTEHAPRPWEGVSLLSPALRAARQVHKDKLVELNQRLEAIQQEEAALRNRALETEKAGRRLLPQIPLTIPICSNYRIKIAAARSKAVLLQRMDVGVMKAAISNDKDTGTGIISQEDMRLTIHSLKTRDIKSILLPDQSHFFSNKAELRYVLDEVMDGLSHEVDKEVAREVQRQQDFDEETALLARAKNWDMKRKTASRRPCTPSRFATGTGNVMAPWKGTTYLSKSLDHHAVISNKLGDGSDSSSLAAGSGTSSIPNVSVGTLGTSQLKKARKQKPGEKSRRNAGFAAY